MLDTIVVKGLRVEGRHGVLDSERVDPQPFEVDIEIETDSSRAVATDDIAETLDYAIVAGAVETLVKEKSFSLLERLADEIAGCVLALGPARSVCVTVKKTRPPMPSKVDFVAVRAFRQV